MRIPPFVTVVAVALAALTSPVDAVAERCTLGFTPDTTRSVFDALRAARDATCTFDGVTTDGASLEARFSTNGRALPPISFQLEDCERADRRARIVTRIPTRLANDCPSVARAVYALERDMAHATFHGDAPVGDPAPRIASVLLLFAIVVLAARFGMRARKRLDASDRPWFAIALAGFAIALAIRSALPTAPSNWYLDVLPPRGPPTSTRFGAGAMALPYVLRALHLWSEPALFAISRIVGAAAVPLVAWIVRECRGSTRAAGIATLLVSIAPMHARISASGSEHVLASTATLGALATWLYATRTRDVWGRALALALAAFAASTRVDTLPQLIAIPLWALLRDREERLEPSSWQQPARDASLAFVVLGVTAALAAWFIARPSRHPFPEWRDMGIAARHLFSQHWVAARAFPRWLSTGWVVSTLLASVLLAWRRPWLLVRVILALALTYVPLGRTLEFPYLIEMRYFLFAIVVAQLPLAFALDEAIERFAPQPRRRAFAVAAGALLAAVSVYETRSAFATRFTYEDEYAFLRDALARVPAGCVVVATPQRVLPLPGDADCCLDVPRSPLVVRYPELQFARIDRFPLVARPTGATPCVVYYESPLCQGSVDDPRWRRDVNGYRDACRAQRSHGVFVPLAEKRVSPRSTRGFFDHSAPIARLYRWLP